MGASARIGDAAVWVGRPAELPGPLRDTAADAEARGDTVAAVMRDGEVLGLFAVSDRLKADAPAAIGRLRDAGVRVRMVTGDRAATAAAIATAVGIDADAVRAEVLPGDKVAEVRAEEAAGRASRSSATASTTRRRSRARPSAWRSGRGPTWRLPRPM